LPGVRLLQPSGPGRGLGYSHAHGAEQLKIPSGAQSGEVLRLKGKGLKEIRSQRSGDLFVRLQVRTPDKLTREEKELLRQLAKLRNEPREEVVKARLDKLTDIVH